MARALDLVASSRRRRADVTFLGGEPLLGYPLIVRAVRRLGRRFPGARRPEYTLATNGLLLTPRRLAFLERHGFDIQLSFDGVAAAQDVRTPGTFGTLDRLLDLLRLRHGRYFRRKVMAAVTVTAPAIPHLADSFSYFLSKGVEDIAIGPAMGHPRLSAARTRELDRQFRLIFARSLEHYRATERVPLRLFRKTTADPKRSPRSDLACVAAIGRDLAVDVDGERRRARLPHAALAAGIFGPQSRKRSSVGACAACRHAAVCFVCPIACAKNPDSAGTNRIPEFQCAFNRIALRYRRRFPIQR